MALWLVQVGAVGARDPGESIRGAVQSSGPTSSSESIGGLGRERVRECEREGERERFFRSPWNLTAALFGGGPPVGGKGILQL